MAFNALHLPVVVTISAGGGVQLLKMGVIFATPSFHSDVVLATLEEVSLILSRLAELGDPKSAFSLF